MIERMKLPSAKMRGAQVARFNLVAAFVLMSCTSLLLILFQLYSLQGALQRSLALQGAMLAPDMTLALARHDRAGAERTLARLSAAPAIELAVLYAADGTPFARHARNTSGTPAPTLTLSTMHAGLQTDWLANRATLLSPLPGGGALLLRSNLNTLHQDLIEAATYISLVSLFAYAVAILMVRRTRAAAQHAENHLHYLAHVDPVTQLPNRHEFNEALAYALARADRQDSSLGLLLLDLDNFKVINDTLGHQCGDQLLQLVARRLTAIVRSADVVCRIGGDEFVVIVEPADNASELACVSRKLLAALAEPFALQGHQLYVSASIGVSLYPFDAHDVATLTRNADTAMYYAKRDGKNRYAVFRAEMEERAQRRLRIEANLRRALQNDELYLHYQPQVDLRSGRIVGVEALIRWNCRELGPLNPAEFIPVAEESGVIVELGRWVLHSACRQAASWCKAGLLDSLEHVAVNVSACQAREPGLMDDIRAILKETQLPHGLLELEITEGVMMDNVHANVELMHRLQETGVHLSIDDFGTGYSSMSYLKRLPIDQLKIDRSFVHDLPGEGEAIITAIIAMAHSLNLKVVAEGVETPQQVAFLRKAGCDNVQGYFFARPMTAAQLTALLLERRDWSRRTVMAHGNGG